MSFNRKQSKILPKTLVIVVGIVLVVAITALLANVFFQPNNTPATTAVNDYEQQIRDDLLSGSTDMEKAMAERIILHIVSVDNTLTVTVQAPDISNDLITWMNAVSEAEFTEQLLAEKILRLINETPLNTSIYQLAYTTKENRVEIFYSTEFANTLSCGLLKFHAEVTQKMVEEMENIVQ